MKKITLFFAYVALLNLAKVGAMNHGAGLGRGRSRPIPPRDSEPRQTVFPNPHPDLGPWTAHNHTHSTEIQTTVSDPNNPQKGILISRVVNGESTNWHLLKGYLVPDLRVASCNGPYGSVTVDLYGSGRSYACLQPYMYHNETKSREHNDGIPVFLATVRVGRVRYEADLAPSSARFHLKTHGLLYHGEDDIKFLNLQPVGYVRYIKSDPIIDIDVNGHLYKFPQPEPRA